MVAGGAEVKGKRFLSVREKFEDSGVYAFSVPFFIYPSALKPELT